MTAEKYMDQAQYLNKMIDNCINDVRYYSAQMSKITDSVPSDEDNPTEEATTDCAEEIVAARRNAEEKAAELIKLRSDMSNRIDMLDKLEERLILRYRYLDGLSWKEIEDALEMSDRTVFRIHKKALGHLPLPVSESCSK